MNRQFQTIQLHVKSNARGGVTLTEVLMSLLIMSVGVVSLATLFPISTLRILEATNHTNATVLRFSAEGLVDAFPNLIHEPDGGQIVPGSGSPGVPTRELGRNYVVDPLGWWERYDELDLADGTRNQSVPYNDPALIYFETNRPSGITLPSLTSRLTTQTGPVTYPAQSRFLGENPSTKALFTTIDIARQLGRLPDTFTDIAQGFPDEDGTNPGAYVLNSSNRVTGLVLPAKLDLTVVKANPALYQIQIYDKSGRYSETRRCATATGTTGSPTTITWEYDTNGNGTIDVGEDLPLPKRFGSPNIGLVRVDQSVLYYSWMLTVRRKVSGPANVDVVIFNKRDFSPIAEQVWIADLRRFTLGPTDVPGRRTGSPKPGVDTVDDNQNGVVDDAGEIGYPGSDDQPNNRVMVNFDPTLYTLPAGLAASEFRPKMKRGTYVFDTANGLWYRIRGIEEADINGDGVPDATAKTLVFESTIARDSTEDVSGDGTLGDISGEDRNNNNALDRGGILVMPSVIAVFPLETK